jgi:tetratricopeptide (TPR) repeat protein
MKLSTRLLLPTLLLSLAPLTACNGSAPSRAAADAIALYQGGQFQQAAATMAPEITKKDENFVLNNCRYGSAALAANDLAGAENAFMAAYEVINGVNTNDGGRTMGATLVFEGVKVWKGEPFERAMAHYYLGLVFLLKNDYENARAAFQNSLFKLREYANADKPEDYRAAESNFALGYFGLGFCYQRLGKSELAQANYAEAAKIDPGLAPTIAAVQQPGVNTLLFIDAGAGPQRAPKGWYNEESYFLPKPEQAGPVPPAAVLVDGKPVTPPNLKNHFVDTLAMAQEQRWQDIDTIRKTKAVIGTGLMAGGAAAASYGAHEGDEGLQWAGIGAMVAGAALSASSQADTRYWEMLPRTVYIVPARLTPGEHKLFVTNGRTPPQTLTITPTANKDTILYFRLLGPT